MPRPSTPKRQRNAEDTRARILEAATAEFADSGLAGTRVDRVAERADVSVRMLYHYFGSKDDLYQAALAENTNRRFESIDRSARLATTLTELFDELLEVLTSDQRYARLIMWEALGVSTDDDIVLLEEREKLYRVEIDRIRELQAAGTIPDDFDADLLWLFAIMVTYFPIAMPQITRITTGAMPKSDDFVERYRNFLRTLGKKLG